MRRSAKGGLRRARLVAGMATCVLTAPPGARAQDASWLAGAAADFGTAARWSPATVPTGIATFGGAGGTVTNVDLTGGLGAIVFSAGSAVYLLQDARGTISGAGIANGGTAAHELGVANGQTLAFTNAATVDGVRLSAGTGSSISFAGTANAATATIALGNAGTLEGSGLTGALNVGTLLGGVGSTVAMGSNALRLGAGASVFGGQITGSGGVSVVLGSLTLSAAQGFTGGVDIQGGRVTITDPGALGADGGSFSGATAGELRVDANGSLATPVTWNAGANGTLAAAAGRTVTLTGQFNADASSQVRLGSASDTGTLVMASGVYGFAPVFSLAIEGGTVRDGGAFSDATARAATTTVAAGATLDFNDRAFGGVTQIGNLRGAGTINTGSLGATVLRIGQGDFAGGIQGAGALRIADVGTNTNGTLVLTGTNTYAGGTIIDAGHRLQIGNGGTGGSIGAGAVQNDGTLVANRSDTLVLPNVIGGNGGVTQVGSGTLVLSATNSYTGPTLVNAGTLLVNGSIASSSGVTIGSGAALGGGGALPAVTVASGGSLAPGNSVGTVTINGNFTLSPGGTLVMEVAGAAADRIIVTGNATLGGALRLVPLGGGYSFNTAYTLLTAASVTGALSGVSTTGSFGAGVTADISQTGTALLLTLSPAALVSTPGLGPFAAHNLRVTAAALDGAQASGRDMSAFFNVYNQPAGTIGTAVNQLSGEVATAGAEIGFSGADRFLAIMLDPFGYGRDSQLGSRLRGGVADGGALSVWGSATAASRRMAGDAGDGSATRETRLAGFALGIDRRMGKQALVGAALSVGEGRAGLSGGLGIARGDLVQAGLHGAFRLGSVTLAAAGSAGWLDLETERTLDFLGPTRLRSDSTAMVWSMRAEAVQDGAAIGAFRLQPLAALQWQRVDAEGYRERNAAGGATGYASQAAAADATTFRGEIGGQVQGRAMLGERPVAAFARLSWAHYLERDVARDVGIAALPDQRFTVRGARRDRDAILATAGIEASIAPGLTLGARLDSETSTGVRDVGGTARLRYAF